MDPLHIREIVGNVTCDLFPTWNLRVHDNYLQIEDPAGMCAIDGMPLPWKGRKWQISPHMTETELVMTCFKAWEAAIDHEFREHFRYRGLMILDPHRSVQALMNLDGIRDVRA